MKSATSTALPVLLTVACSAPETAPVADVSSDVPPPAFPIDDRRARIEAAFPSISEVFRRNAEENHLPGHVWGIVVDGELALTDAVGVANLETAEPVDVHTRFHIASLTKSVTSMAVLKLRDEGRLSLTDPVARYVPAFAALDAVTGDAPPIVVEQLMTMTSGLPEDNPWADRQLEDTDEELDALLDAGLSLSTVPGSGYEYSNLGYALLGRIITRASGRPYQDYVTEEVLLPLGMDETVWDYRDVPDEDLALGYRWEDERWKLEPMLGTGAFGSIGGLITSMRDFGRYVGFHLDAYPARGGADDGPLRRSSVREMHVAERMRLVSGATDPSGEPCPTMAGYGYGLGVREDCHGVVRVRHTGGLPGFGSNVQFFPQYGVGVISFANRTYAASGAEHERVNAILFDEARLVPRELPVSDVLAERARQVAELVVTWDDALCAEILADNVFLDRSKERRRSEAEAIFAESGPIVAALPVEPLNRLRGSFVLEGERRDVRVYFTMSPERPPRVQRIDLSLVDGL